MGRERAILCCRPKTPTGPDTCRVEKHNNIYSLDQELRVEKLPFPNPAADKFVSSDSSANFQFLGCCNGLLLTYSEERFYLWNPSTKWCRKLTQLDGLVKASIYRCEGIASGICFDDLSDNYKVVLIDKNYGTKRCLSIPQPLCVASLREKKIVGADDSFPYMVVEAVTGSSTVAALVNGHLHWIVRRSVGDRDVLIIRFDGKTNQFNEFPMPEGAVTKSYFGLTSLKGCLCMSRVKSGSIYNDNDIFIMREYGVKQSWTKLFTVVGVFVHLPIKNFSRHILVSMRDIIYTYNPKLKERTSFKQIELQQSPESICDAPLMYVESFAAVDWL